MTVMTLSGIRADDVNIGAYVTDGTHLYEVVQTVEEGPRAVLEDVAVFGRTQVAYESLSKKPWRLIRHAPAIPDAA